MAVRVYSHETATVPDTYGQNGFPLLRAILVACLVSGTGGVPGAGWQLVADNGSATGYFVIGNGSSDLFICFAYDSGTVVKISMASSFSGVSASGFIIGEAARSGHQPGFATYHRLYTAYLGGTAASSRVGWCVAADETAFVFTSSAASNSTNYTGAGMDTTATALVSIGQSFGAGRTTKGAAYFVGGSLSAATVSGFDFSCTYIEDPATGLLIPSTDTIGAPDLSVRSVLYGFSPSTTEFLYEDLPSIEGHLHVSMLGNLGSIKGVLFLPTLQQGYYRHVLRRLGMAPVFDTMNPQDIPKVIRGTDGHDYAYAKVSAGASASNHATPCLVTNNPRVW